MHSGRASIACRGLFFCKGATRPIWVVKEHRHSDNETKRMASAMRCSFDRRMTVTRRILISALVLLAHRCVAAADDLSRGEAMIENYFRKQAAQISSKCLVEYTTKAEWEEARPELRR